MSEEKVLVLDKVTVIDDRGAREGQAVVIKNGKIEAVDRSGSIHESLAKKAEVLDLHGQFVTPGLIDAHVHLMNDADPESDRGEDQAYNAMIAYSQAKTALRHGVTAVRDLGSQGTVVISLGKAVDEGLVVGPTVISSGQAIVMTGGHGHRYGREADGPHEVRKAVREQLKRGAKVIKMMCTGGVMTDGVDVGSAQLTEEEMRAGIEEAHKAGRKVATHGHGAEGIKNALRAGVDSVEHGTMLDDEAIELMLANDAYYVPTLCAPHFIAEYGEEGGIPAYAVRKTHQVIDYHRKSFQMALEAGITIAMGTDSGTPYNQHGRNAMELVLMNRLGMSAQDAITAATRTSAELLGLAGRMGRVEPGFDADLLVLEGNPLDELEVLLGGIQQVYKGGMLAQ